MKNFPFARTGLSLAAGALLLAACGGGGGGSGSGDLVSGTDVPNSATTGSSGAFTFVSSVAATSDNSAEPLVVGDATLATSNTDEPDPSI